MAGNRYGNRKISTRRCNEHERKIRDARKNPCADFANSTPPVPIEYLSEHLLDCTRCGLRKPEYDFHRNKYNAHRRCRASQCKDCRKELMAKRWAKISPKQRAAHTKANRKTYKKNKEKRLDWQKEYRERNAEKIKEQKK